MELKEDQSDHRNEIRNVRNSGQEWDMHDSQSWLRTPTKRKIRLKIIISLILFTGIWGMFQLKEPWSLKGQQFVQTTLTKEIAFESMAAWYQSKFSGAPSFIPSFHLPGGQDAKKVDAPGIKSFFTPVHGKLLTPFSTLHQAITLQTQANALISAIDTGRVIFAGVREDSGNTIVIQHAGGYQSTYGMLQQLKWGKNDWIKAGEVVGTASAQQAQTKGIVYLALMKDTEYLNPLDVISFE
jgi:stage IV sporulation protein FA